MKRLLADLRVVAAAMTLSVTCASNAASWDLAAEYSITANPNGVWSYDRKWAVDALAADVMTVRWGDSGWYLGNVGNGGPSIQASGEMWAKNNGNGYPDIRWTSPSSSVYNIAGHFIGDDIRGVDSFVYVVVNGSISYSDRVTAYLQQKDFSLSNIFVPAGAPVDFVITWAGGVTSEASWTRVAATISAVPEPAQALTLALGLVALGFKARSASRF